jgi:phosphoglycerate dehydrogenase-like enzyme
MKIALLDDYQGVAMQCAAWDKLPADCEVVSFRDHLDDEEAIAERLAGFEIVMLMRERTPFPRSLLEKLPKVRMIANTGMWNATLDLECCTERGILVCGTAGGSMPTFELTWGLIFAVMRNIPLEHERTRQGAWQQSLGVELAGKTLGLLGLGTIGRRVAQVGRAFDMEVIAWSLNLTDELARECGARRVPREQLLGEADVLSIHYRLGERSRGMIGKHELALMKATAYLINTARSQIVDEAALVEALRNRAIAGAALDVFDQEPLPAGHPLLALDNCILSPHMGYVTREVYRSFYGETLENILGFLAGEPVRVLNPELLEAR